MPKNNRGLLSSKMSKTPGPVEYLADQIAFKNKAPITKMGKASRDIPFSKYGSVHAELVRKGIY
jgi:hypothetical protein